MLEPGSPLLEELCHSKPPFIFAATVDAPSYNHRAFCWNQGPPALELPVLLLPQMRKATSGGSRC